MAMNHQALLNWIVTGEVGVSSKAMWAAITGAVTGGPKGGKFDVPYDPADFQRCLNFVNFCGIEEADLQKVKEVFPWWGPQIDNWSRLVELLIWGTAPKLFDLLEELESQSVEISKSLSH